MCRHFIIAKHARAAVTNQFRLRPILAAPDDEDIDSILMIRVHSFGPFFSDTWKKKVFFSMVLVLCLFPMFNHSVQIPNFTPRIYHTQRCLWGDCMNKINK